jgi:hypothetical protein
MADIVVIDGETGKVEDGASGFDAQVQKAKFVMAVQDAGVEVPALQAMDDVLRAERNRVSQNARETDAATMKRIETENKIVVKPKKKGFVDWLLGN